MTDLPPGTYTYRASGPRHSDKTGRIFVRPGITTTERVHLQYQTISIDFSVTETTIPDVYDINLEATFQTQVPAPVVLLEPLSINLPELQIGEEHTGELTLTNYGLIQAEDVVFKPPQSDEYYRYEFLADIPKVLAAKQRVVIPYRVTAVKLHPKGIGFTNAKAGDFTAVQRALVNTFSSKASSCSSYSVWVIQTPGATKSSVPDALQRPTSIQVKNGSNQILASKAYKYDKAGNISQIDSDLGTTQYGYDNLDRLTQAVPDRSLQGLGLPSEHYGYDAVGNRTSSAHQPGAWVYNADNQMVRYPEKARLRVANTTDPRSAHR